MNSHNSIISDGLVVVERTGNEYLGVDTGIPSNSPSLRKLAGQKRQNGWIVHESGVEEWQPLGFVERDGKVHVYGPLHRGRFLDAVLDDESADRFGALARVEEALEIVNRDGGARVPFHTRTLVLLDSGGVLILPPDIMQAIREHQDYAERIRRMERFNHPDRTPEQNVGFALAAAAYYVVTGEYPFDSDDEEEIHARVRAAAPVPARFRDVSIRRDVSDTLQEELTSSEGEARTGWADRLRSWRDNGVRQEPSDAERERLEQAARQGIERIEKSFRRKESVRRNGRTVLIVAAIVIIVGTIPGTIIRNALQPRATAGLAPEEVVRTFYTSINSLDHMTMEDAVVDKAGNDLIREVTNLFVIDRQRMSVEMQSGFVDAQMWRDEGMPAFPDSRVPYGVANLQLEALAAQGEERAYEASYERWLPDYDEAQRTGRSGILGLHVVDSVSLRLDKDDWVIYRIERVSEDGIDVQELRARESEPAPSSDEDAADDAA